MKSKVLANVILGLIILTIIGIIVYFLQITRSDLFGDAANGESAVKILLSFDYSEADEESESREKQKTRVMSMLLLMNLNTKKLGILELPAYTGVYNQENRLVLPIDMVYGEKGYKDYVSLVASKFNVNKLHYVHIKEKDIADFIDLIGGLKIFLIGEEYSFASAGSTSLGDTYFDGNDVRNYLNNIENDVLNEEILKSTKRKEFINAIIKQIQKQNVEYSTSTKMIGYIYKVVDTSLEKNDLNSLFLSLINFDLDNAYFQRISGELKDVDLQQGNNNEKVTILFTSSEVGGLANVVKTVENKLATDKGVNSSGNVTVTILNGTNITGLASKTKDIYNKAGFNVISIGNSNNTTLETTTLIDRVGDKTKSNLAAQVIGIRSIITDITSVDEAGAELTIILGRDFDGEYIK